MNAIPISPADKIHLDALPYKFPMRNATTHQAELRQMAKCLEYGFPMLAPRELRDDTLSVVGYGPTLKDTWEQITHPCITTSGAHDFLLDRGIVPDFHAQCDGRDHQTAFLSRPQAGTIYLMSTICAPGIWECLKGQRVYVWHQAAGPHVVEWIGKNDPGGIMIAGGSNIGLAAIHLGGLLGFRTFKLFGIDGHRDGSVRHAGPHPDPVAQQTIWRKAGGRTWATSPQMSNACDELLWLMRDTPDLEVTVHGDSLQAAVLLESPYAFWPKIVNLIEANWGHELRANEAWCATLRSLARYNTGSIEAGSALLLRALSKRYRPRVIVEVGTFIGMSTLALKASEHLYTCDKDNDCLPSAEGRTCHPYTTSTAMLSKLVGQGCKVDLFFFDGRIQGPDVPLILRLAHHETVYAFDDYEGREKGVVNVELLAPFLEGHALMPPCSVAGQRNTIAVLAPRSNL